MSRTGLQLTLADLHPHTLWSLCQCALESAIGREKWFLKGKMWYAFYLRNNAVLLRGFAGSAPVVWKETLNKHSQTALTWRLPQGSQRFLCYWFYIKRVSQTRYKCLEKAHETTNQELIKFGLGKVSSVPLTTPGRYLCSLAIVVCSDSKHSFLLHSQESGRAQENFGWRNFLFDLLVAKSFIRFLIYPFCFGFCDRIILPIANSNISVPERSGIIQGNVSPVTITNCWEQLRELLDCPGGDAYSQVPFHQSTPHDQVGIASLFPYHQSLGQHHQPKRCWATRKKGHKLWGD